MTPYERDQENTVTIIVAFLGECKCQNKSHKKGNFRKRGFFCANLFINTNTNKFPKVEID